MNKIITLSLFFISIILPFVLIFNTIIVNPLGYLINYTGHAAIFALILVLLCSRLKYLNIYLNRKYLGLIAFIYTSFHILIYSFELDYDFDYILYEAFSLNFITLGYLSYILFLPLVFTSNETSKSILKDYWYLLHKLVYATIILALIHYYLTIKADMSWLWIYIITFTILFINFKIQRNE